MSTDRFIPMSPRVERMEREKAFDAGFAAALSEHEQIGWWHDGHFFSLDFASATPRRLAERLRDGAAPVYLRRSVEVQSSEVPEEEEN